MAQDLRNLFKEEHHLNKERMPKGHEARFLDKLKTELPEQPQKRGFGWLKIAASVVLLLGLSFTAYKFFDGTDVQPGSSDKIVLEEKDPQLKSLGDVSPDLKKIEDYYVANINLELSNVKVTEQNKELFDSYVLRLGELNSEYKRLSQELTENGPNELTVSALIDNLKLRLNLLYRLKKQLKELNGSVTSETL